MAVTEETWSGDMASSTGSVLLVILLGIAVGSANDDDTGVGDATTAGAPQGFGTGTTTGGEEDICEGTSSFDNDAGTFVVPTDSNNDLFAARDCVLSTAAGSGAPVEVLQNALATCYQQPVAVDGMYGPGTAAAVQAVQAFHGLPADGVFGSTTNEAMRWPTTSPGGQVTCAADD
jgi:peptidoglycan hydrolase-like protein with peptidoglycan-binding domain